MLLRSPPLSEAGHQPRWVAFHRPPLPERLPAHPRQPFHFFLVRIAKILPPAPQGNVLYRLRLQIAGFMADTITSSIGFSGKDLLCIRGERAVFSGLSFAMGAGDALVLTGPNGSGKSSLLRLMAGLLPPASGALFRDGEDIREAPEEHRSDLHYVGHLDAVKPVLTVSENLAFWAGIRTAPQPVGGALEQLGLAALADTPRTVAFSRTAAAPEPCPPCRQPGKSLAAGRTNRRAGFSLGCRCRRLDLKTSGRGRHGRRLNPYRPWHQCAEIPRTG